MYKTSVEKGVSVRSFSRTMRSKQCYSPNPVGKVRKKNLTPLQRLQKFKKLQEKQAKEQRTKPKNRPGIKKVTFALNMEVEGVLNGSHKSDVDMKEEKILKPRKPVVANDLDGAPVQSIVNGSNENGSVSDIAENDNVENGYDEDIGDDDTNKQIGKKRLRHQHEKKEGTAKRDSKFIKESTPKPDTPSKRELRRRETTPKPETPSKRDLRQKVTPSKVQYLSNNEEFELMQNEGQQQIMQETNVGDKFDEEKILPVDGETQSNYETEVEIDLKLEESVVVLEGTTEENLFVSINESKEEVIVEDEPKARSFFSVFRRGSKSNTSTEKKDAYEAYSSSQSIICLDTPSVSDDQLQPTQDIKGRKPINSFSKFPGRNVSVTSIDRSLKRKADNSFSGDEERKRFAGETESGSEKSPGWRFFSPSFARVWSPTVQKVKSPIPSSTPFRNFEKDSIGVNLDEDTKLPLDDYSVEAQAVANIKKPVTEKWCTVM